ncbi:MAG: hypothetical protein D6805_02850 [Planctomycetota bacterium]|nr:MAG: hypothetical protein D6805_02850 [Planctomycetota bacterium]
MKFENVSDEEVRRLVEMIRCTAVGKKRSVSREFIREQLNLITLEKVYRVFEKRSNTKTFFQVLEINANRWSKILQLIKYYKSLLHTAQGKKQKEGSLSGFLGALGEFGDFRINRVMKEEVAYIQLINPFLECLKGNLFFFYSKGDAPSQELQQFVNLIESGPQEYFRKVAFILTMYNTEDFIHLTKESRYRFVVLHLRNLKNILLASKTPIAFNQAITEQLDLLDIQPYRTHGSTSSLMFFGRKKAIDLMMNDQAISYAIYGGRQMGKTSLLKKIQEILNEESGQKTVFITCEGVKNNLFLGREILKQLGVDSAEVETVEDFEQRLRDYLRSRPDRVTVFIDEVDDLVDIDRRSASKIFVSLRNIHNDFKSRCRFFFAGFKKLYSEFYRLYAPFRNFAEPFELKELSKKDCRRLIEEPMCHRLGIRFLAKKKIVDKIYEYTAGHPCFVQHYCKCLIEKIASENRRYIQEEDVEDVYRSEAYRDLVVGNHLDNFREGEEQGDILPKLLVCHIIFEDWDSFTELQLMESLKSLELEMEPFQLRSELRKLTMTSVLKKEEKYYRFTNSIYPRILRERENLADILLQLVEEAQKLLKRKRNDVVAEEESEIFILRRREIEQILKDSGQNYAILGGNGVGKSSMLATLKEIYGMDLSYKMAYVQAKAMRGLEDLLQGILTNFHIKSSTLEEGLEVLKEFVAESFCHGRRVLVLMDDVEGVFLRKRSQAERVLEAFEQLSAELSEGFRVILTGGIGLLPLLDMEILHLTPLDEREAKVLAFHFIKQRGLELEDKSLLELLLEYTGRNPALLEKLIALIQRRLKGGGRRVVLEEDIEQVSHLEDFHEALICLYEGGLDEGKKCLLQAILSLSKEKFTSQDISIHLPLLQVEKGLEELFFLGILKKMGRRYRLSNPYYGEVMRKRCTG